MIEFNSPGIFFIYEFQKTILITVYYFFLLYFKKRGCIWKNKNNLEESKSVENVYKPLN